MTSPSPRRKATTAKTVAAPKRSWITRKERKPLPPKEGWRHLVPRWRTALAVVGGGFLLGLIGFAALYASVDIPKPNDAALAQSTILYYSDGKTELSRVGSENREVVPLDRIPKHVQDAVLAAEDGDFYSSPGISTTGIFRAAWANLRGGGIKQGGSGITQQYAKVTYLTQERTFSRKMKEIVIAMKLDKTKSKEEILEGYLNTIWFGRGASGIQAASQAYFHKNVDKLTPAEGAVLAASIRAPALYDPTNHPKDSRARWDYVVGRMVETKALTQAEADKLKYPKVFKKARSSSASGPERFIENAVLNELEAQGITEEEIETKGLRVRTTIDAKAQKAAVEAQKTVVQEAVQAAKKKPVSALVSIEPGTGRVKAMYGGASYGKGGCEREADCLNLATQAPRQPGSTFKAFVLSAALASGKKTLDDRYDGPETTTLKDGTPVRNDAEGETCFNCTLLEAMAHSINTIYEPLAEEIGPELVKEHAHAVGIPTDRKLEDKNGFTGPSIALGTYDVRVIDMASSFATFAAEGVHARPYFVESVTDVDGENVYKAKADTAEVLQAGVAADVTAALKAVVDDGTGTRAQLNGRPAAGKTGTTQESRNAWFVGYTPQLATAVWMGNVDSSSTIGQVPGYEEGLYGGALPAMTFKAFMDGALEGADVKEFPKPRVNVAPAPVQPSSTSASPSPTTSSAKPTPTQTTVAPQPTDVPTEEVPTDAPVTDPLASEPAPEPPAEQPGDGGGQPDGGRDPARVDDPPAP